MFREGLLSTLYSKKLVLVKVTAGILLFVFLIGTLIHYIEPNEYPHVFDGMWWAIVTISTVGYGDFVPQSITGRILGMILILAGIAIFSFFITNLAASTVVLKEQKEKGFGSFKNSGHLIVIGWNERSRMLIQDMHKLYPYREIVLVDETLQKLPQGFEYVRFIKGSPRGDEALNRANLEEAGTAVITASHHIEERTADANTILSLISIKSLAPDVYTIAEVITHDQVKNAQRAGADEVVEASYQISLLLMNSTLYHGLTDVVTKMLEHEQKNHLSIHLLSNEYIGKTFGEVIHYENSSTQFLLGLRRDHQTHLHPSDNFFLQKEDELIFVRR
ncbi:potassium channel family protein [Salipaludibacillus daqingensis]|uniref:potassium channel family protein n=1 Tax=Salipaludibacillus daqingensis TaxID=3041001 RepID=UPI0024762132|nr:potassium channel protein [Salipaludibacillus daqingensis]